MLEGKHKDGSQRERKMKKKKKEGESKAIEQSSKG